MDRKNSRRLQRALPLSAVLWALCAALGAQTFSHILSFQGRLCATDGRPVPDGPYIVTFRMYATATGGAALWTENQGVTQVGGVFVAYLGSVTAFPANLFSDDDRWLGIAVGGDPEMPDRFRLTPSPWAMRAAEADHAANADQATSAQNADKVDSIHASATPTANYLLALDGSGKFPNSVLRTGSGNGLDADLLDGQHGAFYQNASNLNAGTLPSARLSGTYSQPLTFSNVGNSFTGNGAGLTSLNASNLASGTVPDARLTSNVALLNTVQTFTADKYFTGNVGIGTTSPQFPLHVQNPSDAVGAVAIYGIASSTSAGEQRWGIWGETSSTNTSNPGAGVMGRATAGNSSGVRGETTSTSGTGVSGFATAYSGTTYGLRAVCYSPDGYAGWFNGRGYFRDNVGIGTEDPLWPLSVVGPQGVAYVNSTANNNGSVLELRNSTASPTTLGAVNFNNAGNTYPGQIAYLGSNAMTFRTGGSERVRIDSGGNVGIGTASPTSGLTVVDNNASYPALSVAHMLATNDQAAIEGVHSTTDGYGTGVYGSGGHTGVEGEVWPTGSGAYYGVTGRVNGGAGVNYGVYGHATGGNYAYGVYGAASAAVYNSYAGFFSGNVVVTGTLSKGGGSFKIDHPLDPENKYLSHSFVESPDMMNIYNGNAVLNEKGEAWVELPDWFEALNRDFRYQLTCIGGFAPVYIAEKIHNSRFQIAGGSPGLEVSWQVTGIRQDPYANLHRIQVEEDKPAEDRGLYLHPDAYGQPEEKGIGYRNRPGPTAR
jgi:hypothetical protein